MNSSSSSVSSSKENNSLLLSSLALQGAFKRISSGEGFKDGCTSYSDSSGEEGGWDDGKHTDCPAG